MTPVDLDVAIVGAGAAGLATAIFTKRTNPAVRVTIFEGARQPGAKILVSGGSRCNVTNTVVTDRDFNGGRPATIRRILRALPVPDTVAFFAGIGVPLHEEPGGKLFPKSNRSRDVLNALLHEAGRLGVELRAGDRVGDVVREGDAFRVVTARASGATARAVVLATGGLSLPKTGSDGWGYGVARRLGHTIVATTPALAPLVLDGDEPNATHRRLTGVAEDVRLDVRVDGAIATKISGALLWTHFGVSGPAALDVSRHWLRAQLDGRAVTLTANLSPDEDFESLERTWVNLSRERPRQRVVAALSATVPASVAAALLDRAQIRGDQVLADLTRDARRTLVRAMVELPLAVRDSRGYSYAEATAGGVDLSEVDPSSMQSRRCAGLYLVGEILDVDGRLGGFNFQWAWSSAKVAGLALGQKTSGVVLQDS